MRATCVLIYCADYKCRHNVKLAPAEVDQWPDELRLSDEPRFVCQVCGRRGADVRPDFHWNKPPPASWSNSPPASSRRWPGRISIELINHPFMPKLGRHRARSVEWGIDGNAEIQLASSGYKHAE